MRALFERNNHKNRSKLPRCHNNLDMQRPIATYSEGVSLF